MPKDFEDNSAGSTTGAVSTPELSSSLKAKRRSIRDMKQARNIITSLQQAARERNQKNARIMARYNAEKPYTQSQLEAEGLGWKNNFTTKPLPMIVDKVAPRFRKALEGVKYLTNSSLPGDVPGNAEKSEFFQSEITKLIRSEPGWTDFVSEIAQENALFGFAACAWLDEFHWFPKFFRQDMFYVPTGTKQLANTAQIVALRERFLVHELFALIEDREAAQAAGWNIEATVAAINNAMPETRKSQQTDWERVFEDLVREANVGISHEQGALVVNVWHLLAQEVEGKVSHYILLEQTTGGGSDGSRWSEHDLDEPLFEREDQFDSMADSVAFFCFQQGNGTLHGSKGIGREIYAMAGMLDRARNEVLDRLNLAGKLVIQGDDKKLRRFKMSVVGNALLIDQNFLISERKIDPAVEPFLQLDQFLTSLLDQMAGAVTPRALEGERVTAAAVNLLAGREEEGRDNHITRFLGQFTTAMSTMQKRIVNKDTASEKAKDFQKRMLERMTREELDKLASQPPAETVADYTEEERQKVVIVASEGRGNPLYNQKELERRKLVAVIGEEFANAVLLPDEDPTVLAEQTRLQMLELSLITTQGTQVPVSPRDNHMVHLQVLMPAMESAAQVAAQQPDGLPILQAMVVHATAHFEAAKNSGAPKDQLAEVEKILSTLNSSMEQLAQLAQAQQQVDAAADTEAAAADQIPDEAAPPLAAPM